MSYINMVNPINTHISRNFANQKKELYYMSFIHKISEVVIEHLDQVYGVQMDADELLFNETRKEFEGDQTLVIFPLLKATKSNPQALGESIGQAVVSSLDFVESYNLIKGFLNFSFKKSVWLDAFYDFQQKSDFQQASTGLKILVEFSSPNTNKPLHLGHVRNILLGWSCSNILKAAGNEVVRTQIINDRGIAICKSMLAWDLFGNGKTPASTGRKSDHFVGDYYVKFEQEFKIEYETWQGSQEGLALLQSNIKDDQSESEFFKGFKNQYFNQHSKLGALAKEMLVAWEDNDPKVRELWAKMNNWVYDGFAATYDKLGVEFDSYYYESETYTLGKDIIEAGLSDGIFYKKEDGSVWIDLEDKGLDHKLVLRSDGTSVYMTQDIGTAQKRYKDTGANGMVYVVADEQDYHFQALFNILEKLGEPYHEHLFHLSYGMVDLPTGRMKSREGKVVDADDLIEEVIAEAKKNAVERGETEDISVQEREDTYRKIGMAALKFFILKVNPKKRMVFNPEESVDMQGTTGPYVQNAYVRIQSINRKAGDVDQMLVQQYSELEDIELDIIKRLSSYEETILRAAANYDPSEITTYCYELAKSYHKFYNDVRILGAETESAKAFRISLGKEVARVLQHGFYLLGIEMPERM